MLHFHCQRHVTIAVSKRSCRKTENLDADRGTMFPAGPRGHHTTRVKFTEILTGEYEEDFESVAGSYACADDSSENEAAEASDSAESVSESDDDASSVSSVSSGEAQPVDEVSALWCCSVYL